MAMPRGLGLRNGNKEIESNLLSVVEQQQLVVERTQRLLSSGAPPPSPPHAKLFDKRATIRNRIEANFADELLFGVESPEKGRPSDEGHPETRTEESLAGGVGRDMDKVHKRRFQRIVKHSEEVGQGIESTREAVSRRVDERKDLIDRKLDEDTQRDLQRATQINQEAEEVISKFIKADWVLQDPVQRQREDVDRETRLYQRARDVLLNAPELAESRSQSQSLLELPAEPDGTTTAAKPAWASQEYIREVEERGKARKLVQKAKDDLASVTVEAEQASKQARAIAMDLERKSAEMSFDERVVERRRMLKLKEKADALSSQADERRAVLVQAEASVAHLLSTHTPQASISASSLRQSSRRSVGVWLMAHLDGSVFKRLYFGALSESAEPPLSNACWLCLDDATQSSTLDLRSPAASQRSAGSSVILRSYLVYGSTVKACNGKYIADGVSDGVAKYVNPDGVVLFRTKLMEAPERGVTLEQLQSTGQTSSSGSSSGGNDDDGGKRVANAGGNLAGMTTDLAGNRVDSEDFEALKSVGLRMVVVAMREQVARRQAQRADMERTIEREFQSELVHAQNALKDAVNGKKRAHSGQTKAMRKVDHVAMMLQTPNTTQEISDASVVALVPGADRIIPTSASSVPSLCMQWVMLSCPHSAQQCQRRHYYVSEAEKLKMTKMRRSKEHALDMDALVSVNTREALIEDVIEEAEQCGRNFLKDTRASTVKREHVGALLNLLDRLRLESVRCVECIDRWRDHQESMRRIGGANDEGKGMWAVTVQVTGRELWKASAAFQSKVKRFQRDREPPKKATELHYVGVFPTKVAAIRAYDSYIAKEAARRGTNPNRLPKKRLVARSCGLHFAVEPEGAPRGRPCEQCVVLKAGRGSASNAYKPAYLYQGENYLMKMTHDLDFLAECDPLRSFLKESFPLVHNPFLLAPSSSHSTPLAGIATNGVSLPPPTPLQETSSMSVESQHQPQTWTMSELRSQSVPSFMMMPMTSKQTPLTPIRPTVHHSSAGEVFGAPSTTVMRSMTASGAVVTHVGSTSRLHGVFQPGEWQGSPSKEDGSALEVLDMVRIHQAQRALEQEEELHRWFNEKDANSTVKSVKTEPSKPEEEEDDDVSSSSSDEDLDDDKDDDDDDEALLRLIAGEQSNDTIETVAIYEHRGATLQVPQTRPKDPSVLDGIFCRRDRGKWKGVGHAGPSTRRFEFDVKLRRIGERRAALRDRVGRKLRRECRKSVVDVKLARLQRLIRKGKILKGSRMALDIRTAETVVRRRYAIEEASVTAQRAMRGMLGRKKGRRRRAALTEANRRRLELERITSGVAVSTVLDCLRMGVKQAAKEVLRPVHRTALSMDGERVVLSVHCLEHHDYTHHSMPLRSHEAGHHHHHPHPHPHRVAVDRPHLATPSMDYSLASHSHVQRRIVDWTPRLRLPERYRVTVYSPITNQVRSLVVSECELRARLLAQQRHRQWAHTPPHQQVIGSSYPSTEVSQACVLEMTSLDATLDDLHYFQEPTGSLEACSIPSQRTCWQPVKEARWLNHEAECAEHLAVLAARSAVDTLDRQREAVHREEVMRAACERSCMALEDACMHHLEACEECTSAEAASAKALAFSSRTMRDLEHPEEEDWRQSWDPFEDGNDWRQLKRKRRALRAKEEASEARKSGRRCVLDARLAYGTAKKMRREYDRRAEEVIRVRELAAMRAEELRCKADCAMMMKREAMTRLAGLLTLRYRRRLKPERCLVWREPEWEWSITPEARLEKATLKAWNHLYAGYVRVETPETACYSAERQRSQRYLLTIRQDTEEGRGGLTQLLLETVGAVRSRVVVNLTPEELREQICLVDRSLAAAPTVNNNNNNSTPFKPAAGRVGYAAHDRMRCEWRQAVCEALVRSLKLDMHTGEVTVGQLTFTRRRQHLKERLEESLWWNDLRRKRSTHRSHINQVFHGARQVAGRVMRVVVYETWGDMLVEAHDSSTGHSYSYFTSLAQMVTMLSDEPRVLRAYLASVRLNCYPNTLIQSIVDRFDLTLPGEEGRWWRMPMLHEHPQPSMHHHRQGRFRGPVFSDRTRRVSGKQVIARVYESSNGDLLFSVVAGEGEEGVCYHGPPLTLELHVCDIEHILRVMDRRDLLGPDPVKRAELFQLLLGRLFIVQEHEYYGIRPGDRYAKEIACVKAMGEAFDAFQQWAKATYSPVMRDLTSYFQPPSEYLKPTEGSRNILIMLQQVDPLSQCMTLTEMSFNTGSGLHSALRLSALRSGQLVLSLLHEDTAMRETRLENEEQHLMRHEDFLSRQGKAVELRLMRDQLDRSRAEDLERQSLDLAEKSQKKKHREMSHATAKRERAQHVAHQSIISLLARSLYRRCQTLSAHRCEDGSLSMRWGDDIHDSGEAFLSSSSMSSPRLGLTERNRVRSPNVTELMTSLTERVTSSLQILTQQGECRAIMMRQAVQQVTAGNEDEPLCILSAVLMGGMVRLQLYEPVNSWTVAARIPTVDLLGCDVTAELLTLHTLSLATMDDQSASSLAPSEGLIQNRVEPEPQLPSTSVPRRSSGSPAAFHARLIPIDASLPVECVSVLLENWSEDLAEILDTSQALEKRSMTDSGATLVFVRQSSQPVNKRASEWTQSEVRGPAVWITPNGSMNHEGITAGQRAVRALEHADQCFRESHARQEALRVVRAEKRVRFLSKRRKELKQRVDAFVSHFAPSLLRSFASLRCDRGTDSLGTSQDRLWLGRGPRDRSGVAVVHGETSLEVVTGVDAAALEQVLALRARERVLRLQQSGHAGGRVEQELEEVTRRREEEEHRWKLYGGNHESWRYGHIDESRVRHIHALRIVSDELVKRHARHREATPFDRLDMIERDIALGDDIDEEDFIAELPTCQDLTPFDYWTHLLHHHVNNCKLGVCPVPWCRRVRQSVEVVSSYSLHDVTNCYCSGLVEQSCSKEVTVRDDEETDQMRLERNAEERLKKRARRVLFHRVANAIRNLIRNKLAAVELTQSMKTGFRGGREELLNAMDQLALTRRDVPIHEAIGLPIPGHVNSDARQVPVLTQQVDMFRLAKLLRFPKALKDLPSDQRAKAGECFVSAQELVSHVSLEGVCEFIRSRIRIQPNALSLDYTYHKSVARIDESSYIVSIIQPPASDDLVVQVYQPLTSTTLSLPLNEERRDTIVESIALETGERPSQLHHLAKLISEHMSKLFTIHVNSLTLRSSKARNRHVQRREDRQRKRLAKAERLKEAQRKVEMDVRMFCREKTLEEHRRKLAAVRRRDRLDLEAGRVQEGASMGSEDRESQAIRNYLACDWETLKKMKYTFQQFDADGSGTMEPEEFHTLLFALGAEVSKEDSDQLFVMLDLDGNGCVDFHEFCLWWLCTPHQFGLSRSLESKLLRTKMQRALKKKALRQQILINQTTRAFADNTKK